MGLTYGSFSTEVKDVQSLLDTASKTRLPRLRGEAGFSPLTMARVMEFQFQEGLSPDGDVGPKTKARLSRRKGNQSLPAGRCILVDLINDLLRAFENGQTNLDIRPIKGGTRANPTTRGVFKISRRLRYHTSSKYPIPPGNMDFSLFFHGAEAIHQGPPTVPSHGCIHVEPSQAERLFEWAKRIDITVIVIKRTASMMMSRCAGRRMFLTLVVIAVGCGRTTTRSPQLPPRASAIVHDGGAVAAEQPLPRPEAPRSTCPADTAVMKRGRERGLPCLDLSEVTVADYAGCVARGVCTEPKPNDATVRLDRYQALCNWHHPEGRDRHPVNCVSYDQATVYCSSRGARLPTDVEWALAASNDGQSVYPWGSQPPDASRVNGCGRECPPAVRRVVGHAEVVAQYPGSDGFGGTAPVGMFPRGDNRLGVHDLAGNVAELVVPEAAPASTGDLTAGGGFLTQNARMMSARMQTRTAWAGATSPDLGFRCVTDVR